MELDRAVVDGNASLTEGASLRSFKSPARIRLANGNTATLGASSEARVFQERLVLSKGQALLTSPRYRAEALGFTAIAGAPESRADLEVRGTGAVLVSAIRGPVKVVDSKGTVIARVMPGKALSFEPPESGSSAVTTVTGAVRRDGSRFMLKDELTNLDVELRGSGLERHLGERVEAAGRAQPSADRESQVVLVSRLSAAPQQSGGNRPDPQTGGGNRPDPEPQPKKGMSNGAKIAIVAVVAGGVAGGVIAATGSKGESVSR